MRISTPPAPAETALSGGEAQAREALGRSQGGVSTKLHLRAEGKGRPITAVLTSGERHEQIALEALLEKIAQFYDSQVKATIKSLTSLIEPLLICFMGGIVGVVILAVFLPILNIIGELSGG